MQRFNLKKIGIGAGIIAVIVAVGFLVHRTSSFEITGMAKIAGSTASQAQADCLHVSRRPIAVMMAGDPVTRPLAGIGQADIVFEMPVTPGGVTRMMAVFHCQTPTLIGSIRSARKDFISLAASLGAVYAHWGGEKDALASLNAGIIDNIDALKYEGTTFYRKGKLKPPHNGFSDLNKLIDRAQQLHYSLESTMTDYPRTTVMPARSISNIADTASIGYVAPYDVLWRYDAQVQSYVRVRNGQPEMDATTNQPVTAATVAVMQTIAHPLNEFYQDVEVVGQGPATIYQQGVSTSAVWKKSTATSRLEFVDQTGKTIEFAPGVIWIEIVTQ